ncbi:MAG: sugar phosphate sensor protein [Ignavibacteria bacterium RBG_13_36_8]|nr:MAG: sugar phosphate sensor protein [Ignavibacteria bacterium RBG_13_36_8]
MYNPLKFFKAGTDKPLIEDPEKVNKLYRRYRFQIMMAITVGYGFVYTCRLALSVVKKPLIDGGIFSADDLGIIGSAIFYTYAFGKLTNGFLADHANMKRFFSFGVLVSALINLTMGWTSALWVWAVLWALNGWFQGFGAPAGIVSLAQWFSNKERGRRYGIWSTAHSIGEGLTFVGVAGLVSLFGWQAGFIGPGITCIIVAVLIYIYVQDRPRTLGLPSIADWKNDHGLLVYGSDGKLSSIWELQRSILKIPSIWVLALSSAMMYVTRYAINSWGILYLQEAKGYSLIEAGSMLGLTTLSGIVGCLAYGYASDKLFGARRPPVTLIVGLLEILALCIIFFAPPGNPSLLMFAFLLYGFSLNGLVTTLGGLFATDIAPKKAAGAAMGFIGVFSYLSAATQERISGYLIEQGTTIIDGIRHYDFSSVILFWVGASVLSLILATSLWNAKVSD